MNTRFKYFFWKIDTDFTFFIIWKYLESSKAAGLSGSRKLNTNATIVSAIPKTVNHFVDVTPPMK